MGSRDSATGPNPAGAVPATGSTVKVYVAGINGTTMPSQVVGFAGDSQPHDNMQPYLVIRFIISLFGIFPSPT